ncbi:MAG: response regulator transcription factor [Anaerostipes sp.]|nr:response regulator transcription factor [Anaerostipes sp.]
MRLLIIEDQQDLREIIKKRFEKESYSVDVCEDGLEAMDYLALTTYDGIILDIMLPKLDGLSVLKNLRRDGKDTPVLLLSAKGTVEGRVKGLDLGADDYLVKPFSFDELLARVRSMMRRKPNYVSNELSISDLSLNRDTKEVKRNGTIIKLSSKEYMILEYMLLNQGQILSRDQIEQCAWNFDYEGSSNIIDVYIRYLRKKIDADFEQKLIHTVRGMGYVLKVDQ